MALLNMDAVLVVMDDMAAVRIVRRSYAM